MDRRKRMIQKVHVLKSAAGLKEWQYTAILERYGAESSTELSLGQLERLATELKAMSSDSELAKDVQRKRLLAAVCAVCAEVVPYWESLDKGARIAYAKKVACRAAGWEEAYDKYGRDRINRLGLDRLRSLTYAFSKRKKDMDGVVEAAMEALEG